jgi:hypothetical protein
MEVSLVLLVYYALILRRERSGLLIHEQIFLPTPQRASKLQSIYIMQPPEPVLILGLVYLGLGWKMKAS